MLKNGEYCFGTLHEFLIGGGNSLPNSMGRRAEDSLSSTIPGAPLRASFFDWMMSYTLLAQGTYRSRTAVYTCTTCRIGREQKPPGGAMRNSTWLPDYLRHLHGFMNYIGR